MNLEQNYYFRSYAKSFLQNPIRLDEMIISFFPVTNIVQIRVVINTDDTEVLKKLEDTITCFSKTHIIISASIRTLDEYNWNDNNDLELQRRNHLEIKEIKTIQIAYVDVADIEQFSGHTHEYEGLWFGCSYEMWFGNDYDTYIPLHKIANFNEYEYKNIFENGTVHIKMYKTPNDFDETSCIQRAFMFRKATNCDNAFEVWRNKIINTSVEQGQFVVEIEDGIFPHGGIKLIKAYLDENEQPILKSKAVKVNISDRGTDGRILYEETMKL